MHDTTESQVASDVLRRLAPHFHIHEQVVGRHWSGRRMVIDAIVVPKDDSLWKTKAPRLGIEFKNFHKFEESFDTKDYTKWWAQCHDYAETDFEGHGYVYVFAYNGFSHYRAAVGDGWHNQAVRIFGQLGVGELAQSHDGWPAQQSLIFTLKGHPMWSEARGVVDGKNWSMERKFGSR